MGTEGLLKKVIFKEHVDTRKKPLNLRESDVHLFTEEWERKIRETHVLTLNDVDIVNEIIFQRPGKFFIEYTHPPFDNFGVKAIGLKLLILSKMSRILLPGKRQSLAKGVWISDRRSYEYFHWLTEALPRLVVSREFINTHRLILPDYYGNFAYVKESLKLFDIPFEFCDASTKLKVGELILPSQTAFSGNYNKVVINKLRDIFLSTFADVVPERKIYISRMKAKKRKVTNESEVITLLESFKYEVHCFEDYGFEKQVKLCAEAQSIIGLHGAGLTNMLFMKAGGRVLEIRNEADSHNNCYFSLASDLDLQYYYQLSKGNKSDTHTVDVRVDVDELKKNLMLMMAS